MDYFNQLSKRVTRFTEIPAVMSPVLVEIRGAFVQLVVLDLEDDIHQNGSIKPNNYFPGNFSGIPQDDGRIWAAKRSGLPTDLYILAENTVRRQVEEGLRVYCPRRNTCRILNTIFRMKRSGRCKYA